MIGHPFLHWYHSIIGIFSDYFFWKNCFKFLICFIQDLHKGYSSFHSIILLQFTLNLLYLLHFHQRSIWFIFDPYLLKFQFIHWFNHCFLHIFLFFRLSCKVCQPNHFYSIINSFIDFSFTWIQFFFWFHKAISLCFEFSFVIIADSFEFHLKEA